jgi:2-(1,2-epoxy-1,2-dihydrophenyl)acetyl-CoA isomerase
MEKAVLVEKKNGVAVLTLNRPDSYNSLTPGLLEEMLAYLSEAESDPRVRVAILTGAGKAFCAGGDLRHLHMLKTVKESEKYVRDAVNVSLKITRVAKPVIAMVNGVAAGAGFNLALACDIIFCAASARFSQSFVKVGLIPDVGGTYFLARAVGMHRAKELMFTARTIDAEEAYRLGIVNRIVPDENLFGVTLDFAAGLAKSAPIALTLMKKILNQSDRHDLETITELETGSQVFCIGTEDHKEGVAAFMEKRDPVFKGI